VPRPYRALQATAALPVCRCAAQEQLLPKNNYGKVLKTDLRRILA